MEDSANTNGLILSQYYLPQEVVTNILGFVHPQTLLGCRIVCKRWKEMIDNESLKLSICQVSKSLSTFPLEEKLALKLPRSFWLYIAKHDPFNRNLLEDPYQANNLKYWEIKKNNKESKKVKDEPKRKAGAYDGYSYVPTNTIMSYSSQVLKFSDMGLPDELMDKYQPKIIVTNWYCSRYDISRCYYMRPKFIFQRGYLFRQYIDKTTGGPKSVNWEENNVVYEQYGTGLRAVEIFLGETWKWRSWKAEHNVCGVSVKVQFPPIKKNLTDTCKELQRMAANFNEKHIWTCI